MSTSLARKGFLLCMNGLLISTFLLSISEESIEIAIDVPLGPYLGPCLDPYIDPYVDPCLPPSNILLLHSLSTVCALLVDLFLVSRSLGFGSI